MSPTRKFLTSIHGQRVVWGRIGRLKADGRRVRFHAVRCYGKLRYTADIGHSWAASVVEALAKADTAGTTDCQ